MKSLMLLLFFFCMPIAAMHREDVQPPTNSRIEKNADFIRHIENTIIYADQLPSIDAKVAEQNFFLSTYKKQLLFGPPLTPLLRFAYDNPTDEKSLLINQVVPRYVSGVAGLAFMLRPQHTTGLEIGDEFKEAIRIYPTKTHTEKQIAELCAYVQSKQK